MAELKGKIVLVTGASSGIGEVTARRLATAGYKVYGTSRRGAQLGQRPFEMLPLDVTRDDSVEAAVRDVIGVDGRIDLLVNNAGFGVSPAAAEESSIEAGPVNLQYELFRDRPDDPRLIAAHAITGEWSHHQHRFGAWLSADAVRSALCRNKTRN